MVMRMDFTKYLVKMHFFIRAITERVFVCPISDDLRCINQNQSHALLYKSKTNSEYAHSLQQLFHMFFDRVKLFLLLHTNIKQQKCVESMSNKP